MSTLTIEMLRQSLRQLADMPPVPRIIVSAGLTGGPFTFRQEDKEIVLLSPDDAREFHKRHPLRLFRIISDTSGEYETVGPQSGSFPLDLPLPPFNSAGTGEGGE